MPIPVPFVEVAANAQLRAAMPGASVQVVVPEKAVTMTRPGSAVPSKLIADKENRGEENTNSLMIMAKGQPNEPTLKQMDAAPCKADWAWMTNGAPLSALDLNKDQIPSSIAPLQVMRVETAATVPPALPVSSGSANATKSATALSNCVPSVALLPPSRFPFSSLLAAPTTAPFSSISQLTPPPPSTTTAFSSTGTFLAPAVAPAQLSVPTFSTTFSLTLPPALPALSTISCTAPASSPDISRPLADASLQAQFSLALEKQTTSTLLTTTSVQPLQSTTSVAPQAPPEPIALVLEDMATDESTPPTMAGKSSPTVVPDDADDDSSLRELFQALEASLARHQASPSKRLEMGQATLENQTTLASSASTLDIWVSKWVDYSEKYGLGYLLSTGATGVYFNDSSRIILSSDSSHFEYQDRRAPQGSSITKHTLVDFPAELHKKVTLLKHFRKYLLQHSSKSFPVAAINQTEPVFVKRWLRTKHAILFRMNNHTVQVCHL
jgi:hypothetical protein